MLIIFRRTFKTLNYNKRKNQNSYFCEKKSSEKVLIHRAEPFYLTIFFVIQSVIREKYNLTHEQYTHFQSLK